MTMYELFNQYVNEPAEVKKEYLSVLHDNGLSHIAEKLQAAERILTTETPKLDAEQIRYGMKYPRSTATIIWIDYKDFPRKTRDAICITLQKNGLAEVVKELKALEHE